MHWSRVDGYRMPNCIGGHPALDLCNTWAGWNEPPLPGSEWLLDPDVLLVWSGHAGLLEPDAVRALRPEAADRPAKARRVLASVRALRDDLYAALVDADWEAFDRVAAVAQRSAAAARLVQRDGEARWELPEDLGLDLPLLVAARSAAELLTSPDRDLVRACPGEECGWVFLDRRGTRRWCSMQSCGNRAKTKAFLARQHRRG